MKFSLDENLTEKEKIYDRFLLILSIQASIGFIYLTKICNLSSTTLSSILARSFVPLLVYTPLNYVIAFLFGEPKYLLYLAVYIRLIIFIIMLWKRLIIMAQKKNLPFIGNINNYINTKSIIGKILRKTLLLSSIVTLVLSVTSLICAKLDLLDFAATASTSVLTIIVNYKLYINIFAFFIKSFVYIFLTYVICYLICKFYKGENENEKLISDKYQKSIIFCLIRTIILALICYIIIVYDELTITQDLCYNFVMAIEFLIFFILNMVTAILIKNLCYDKIKGKQIPNLKRKIITSLIMVVTFVSIAIIITFVEHDFTYWIYLAGAGTSMIDKIVYIFCIVFMCLTYFLSTLNNKKKGSFIVNSNS